MSTIMYRAKLFEIFLHSLSFLQQNMILSCLSNVFAINGLYLVSETQFKKYQDHLLTIIL